MQCILRKKEDTIWDDCFLGSVYSIYTDKTPTYLLVPDFIQTMDLTREHGDICRGRVIRRFNSCTKSPTLVNEIQKMFKNRRLITSNIVDIKTFHIVPFAWFKLWNRIVKIWQHSRAKDAKVRTCDVKAEKTIRVRKTGTVIMMSRTISTSSSSYSPPQLTRARSRKYCGSLTNSELGTSGVEDLDGRCWHDSVPDHKMDMNLSTRPSPVNGLAVVSVTCLSNTTCACTSLRGAQSSERSCLL